MLVHNCVHICSLCICLWICSNFVVETSTVHWRKKILEDEREGRWENLLFILFSFVKCFAAKISTALHLGICLQRVVLPRKRKWALWTHFQHVSLVLQKSHGRLDHGPKQEVTSAESVAKAFMIKSIALPSDQSVTIYRIPPGRVFSRSYRSFSKRWFSKHRNATPKTQTQTSKLYMLQGWHWRIKASEMDGNLKWEAYSQKFPWRKPNRGIHPVLPWNTEPVHN